MWCRKKPTRRTRRKVITVKEKADHSEAEGRQGEFRALGHGNDRHNCHSKGNRRHNLERLAQMPFKGKSPACLGNCLEMLTIPVVLVPKAVVYESVAIMSCFK